MKHWLFAYICLTIIKVSQHVVNFRLPTNVIPEYYELNIDTTLDKDNFYQKSSVKIHILCVESTNRITLHSRNLAIKKIKIHNVENSLIVNIKSYTQGEYDFLYIDLGDELKEGDRYKLIIKFRGEIGTETSGYYRSSYIDKNGEEKWFATTSFEPTNARAAFPCFDEPGLKAVFSIKLTHESHFVGISNMPRKSYSYLFKQIFNRKIPKTKIFSFELFDRTPKISTYLVAYTVSDFGYRKVVKSNKYGDTAIHVWTSKQFLEQVEYAKRISPNILSFFEEYFDIAYPFIKSDLVAVPDFSMGATDTWGLTIFRESNLLSVSDKSTQDDQFAILENIAHKMSQYWFGNLVTIKWWKYHWLIKGFATHLARVAIENLVSNSKLYITKRFLENLDVVYDTDGLRHSIAICNPINDPESISQIYDAITYSKGTCIIRMLEYFLGADIMKKGITEYLNKNKYNSTGDNELWRVLSTVAHEEKVLSKNMTVNAIINSWAHQAGFPLVSVIRDYTKGTVTVTQHRYLDDMKTDDESCYWVPLTWIRKNENYFTNTKPRMWLECPKNEIEFEFKNTAAWILFNVQVSGLYRVNYDENNWNLLIKQLNTDHKKIKVLNRILLIEDVVELAITNKVDFQIAFSLLRYLKKENSYHAWRQAIKKLYKIRDFLYSLPEKTLIERYIEHQVMNKYYSLGGINSDKDFTKLDTVFIETACSLGNEDCNQYAAKMFQKWLENDEENIIPECIKEIVLCYGLKLGDEESWNLMWQKYLKSNVGNEKTMLLDALGCTKQLPLLNRYLDKIISKDSGIKQQDAERVFKSVINNEVGFQIARTFFYEHIQDFHDMMSPPGSEIRYFLPLVAKSLKTTADRQEFEEFTKTHSKYFHMAVVTKNQMLEKSIVWGKWYEVTYPKLTKVLEEVITEIEETATNTKEHLEPRQRKRKYKLRTIEN